MDGIAAGCVVIDDNTVGGAAAVGKVADGSATVSRERNGRMCGVKGPHRVNSTTVAKTWSSLISLASYGCWKLKDHPQQISTVRSLSIKVLLQATAPVLVPSEADFAGPTWTRNQYDNRLKLYDRIQRQPSIRLDTFSVLTS